MENETTEQAPKKRIFKQVVCECGGKYTSQNKTSHVRTEKHKSFVDNIPYERPCRNFQLRKEFLDQETLERKRLYICNKGKERKARLLFRGEVVLV
jgi:hypothetical protein